MRLTMLSQALLCFAAGAAGSLGVCAGLSPLPPFAAHLPPFSITPVLVPAPFDEEMKMLQDAVARGLAIAGRGRSYQGTKVSIDGKDAAGLILGSSDERFRFFAYDGTMIGLCACVTYEDPKDAPRLDRDCTCTPGGSIAAPAAGNSL